MKIALISPHFPPDPCGVGDYSAKLSRELHQQGHAVSVWTAQGNPRTSAAPKGGEVFHTVKGPWGVGALARIVGEVREARPHLVLVQFTPYLYSRFLGINPALPLWLKALKASGARIVLSAHELHYPLGLKPDRLIFGLPQFTQFIALDLAADSVLFTYDAAQSTMNRCLPLRKSAHGWLPVGASIEPHESSGETRDVVAGKEWILLQFGGDHPSRIFDYSFQALDHIRKKRGPNSAVLAFVGMDQKQVSRELARSGRMELQSAVRCLGYLPAPAVSSWMRRADLVLAPFVDGASTRRSSIMAALAHGKPVVTTCGTSSGSEVPWHEFTSVSRPDDPASFAGNTLELLEQPGLAEKLGNSGRAFYQEHFSWSRIASELVRRYGPK